MGPRAKRPGPGPATAWLIAVWLTAAAAPLLFAAAALAGPAGDDLARAAALLEKGRATQAYEIYIRLWRADPDDAAAALGLARAAARAKRWNQAALAYEVLLERYPGAAALHGELAQVYVLLGDRVSAENSLARLRELDARVTRDATDQALDAMEEKADPLQAQGRVRFGVLYDSNANQGPASDYMRLGPLPVTLPGVKSRESLGAYLGADFFFSRRFYRDSPWQLVGDVRGYWRGMAAGGLAESRSRESQWGRGALGLRYMTDAALAELRLKGEIFDFEFRQRVSAGGLEGLWLTAVRPNLHLMINGGLDRRDYYHDSLRNGWYGWLGGQSRFFFGQDRHELSLSVRGLGAAAQKTDYGYRGWEGAVSLAFKLPHDLELRPFFSYTQENYRGPATVLEAEDRRDRRLRAGLGLTLRLTETWSAESGYSFVDNRSNSGLYTYDQHAVNLGLAWEF